MKCTKQLFTSRILKTFMIPLLAMSVAEAQNTAMDAISKVETLSLSEALILALDENALVKAASENRQSAEFVRNSARAEMYPTISTGYSYTGLAQDPYIRIGDMPPAQIASSNQFQWDITVVQPLFTGHALSTQLEMAELGVDIRAVGEQQTRANVTKGVTSAYYTVLLTEKLHTVSEETVLLLESLQRDSQRFYTRGIIRLNELLRVNVALANAIQHRELMAASAKMATSDLNRWLAFNINRDTRVEEVSRLTNTHLELEHIIELGLENRPTLRAMRLNLQNLHNVETLERSALYPQITLVGGYQRMGDDWLASTNKFANDHNAFISLNAKWTLFDGSRARSNIERAKTDARAFKQSLRSVEDRVRLEIKSAFLKLNVAERNIETAEVAVKQAEENQRITKLGFVRQAATSTEVLDARTDLTLAKTNFFRSLYAHLDALAELERAVGKKLLA